MSNTNERIAQISALIINYKRMFNADRSISQYDVSEIYKAVNSIAAVISKENQITLEELKRAEEFHKEEEAKNAQMEATPPNTLG